MLLSTCLILCSKKPSPGSVAAKTEENSRDSTVVKTDLTALPPTSSEESVSTNTPIIDAETLAKLTSSLATEMVRLNVSDIEHKENKEVQHELISTSGKVTARSLTNAVASKRAASTSSEEKSSGEKTISVGIPEKFITVSKEKASTRVSGHKHRSGSKRRNGSSNISGQGIKQRNANKNRRKAPRPTATVVKSSLKQQKLQPNRARGTLYGLATLRRQGNVRVSPMADFITVRSNFVLGPLVLKVEKAFGKGTKRELKSATATTTQMIGRVNLRIVNGAATLHSIKVQQPKQVSSFQILLTQKTNFNSRFFLVLQLKVQVDSVDNHDRTREFVWQKSSHIAQVVSQKLISAARSMLQKPPKTSK